LQALITLAGLKLELDVEMGRVKEFRENWVTVKDWSEGARYETGIDKERAHALHIAITAEPNGVLSWLKKYW
jgi:hypothetical protein